MYVSRGEQLRWITSEFHRFIRVLEPISGTQYPELLDAGHFDGRTLAALSTSGSEPMWMDLATGETVEGPGGHIVLGDRYEITVDGLTAYIEESGFGFPRLVVADADGVEVLRTTIGNERLPRARLHDFDGRRLIYTLGPNEPPGFWAVVLDLECPTCTRVLYNTRPTFYDLVGSEPAVSGRPATCSTSGLVADLDPQPDLPAPAARTRQAIFDAAMACDFPRLLALSGYEPRNALLGADGDGWIEQERRHVSGEAGGAPVLQAIVEHIDLPYEGPFGSEQLIVWTSEANELVIDAYGAWVSFGSPD